MVTLTSEQCDKFVKIPPATCSNALQLVQYPISKKQFLAIMPRGAEITSTPFDV